MISQENAKNVLEGLRTVQYAVYTYEEFIKVLKRRLKRYTGKTEAMFYDEKQIVLELGRLGALQEWSGVKVAGSK